MNSKISSHFSTSLLLPIDASDLSYGRVFFKVLQETYPDMMPRKYGNTEPLKNVFDGDIEKMLLTSWKDTFIWKPTVKSAEALWHLNTLPEQQKIHCGLLMSGNPNKFRIDDIKMLYCELIKHNSAHIGHIHLLAEPELKQYRNYYNEMVWALNIGYTTLELKKFIPNLAWGTFFGKPYIELIGLEKLLKAPAFLVEKWHDGVYIQVSENIEDTSQKFDEFDRLRTRIKEHLGHQYFFSPDLPKSEYRVPEFKFSMSDETQR